MKKIFIDCGAFRGESIKRFQKVYGKGYKIYAIEPRKIRSYPPEINLIAAAAWVNDGTILMYECVYETNGGASLIKEKTTGKLNKKNPRIVPCFDFSQWIKDTFLPDDHIVLKMNIEGAEYRVLEKMLSDNSMEYVNILLLSTHHKKIGIDKAVHQGLMTRVSARTILIMGALR